MTLVGLHGVARAGKDTVADILVKQHGFTRVALADAVRDAVYTLNPLVSFPAPHAGTIYQDLLIGGESYATVSRLQDAVDKKGWDAVKTTDEGRRLLQVMGTEVGRNMFGENVWLDIAAKKIDACQGPVVVTDVRFLNELEWLKNWYSNHTVKIIRPGYGPVNEHSSDAGIEDNLFNHVLKNDGTLEQLEASVNELAAKW